MFTTKNLPCIMELDLDIKKWLFDIIFHKGRTDRNGGHIDLFKKSRLGFYHYHHRLSAHLHPDFKCPYESEQTFIINPYTGEKISIGSPYVFEDEEYYSINLVTKALVDISSKGGIKPTPNNTGGVFYIYFLGDSHADSYYEKFDFTYPLFMRIIKNNFFFKTANGNLNLLYCDKIQKIDDIDCYAYISLREVKSYMTKNGYFSDLLKTLPTVWSFKYDNTILIDNPKKGDTFKSGDILTVKAYIDKIATYAILSIGNRREFKNLLESENEDNGVVTFSDYTFTDSDIGNLDVKVEVGRFMYLPSASQVVQIIVEGSGDYIERYPRAYIDGIIKAYETHKIVDGRFVLDNAGQTIAYGHDLSEAEKQSGIYNNGLSMEEGLELAVKDLNLKYDSILGYINSLNSAFAYTIDINNFTENEVLFLIDFAFNRGGGLVERPELKAENKPYSSLAILITSVSEKNDVRILEVLMEETKNLKGVYYEGLKLRRMDQYEILKFGDFVRDYNVNRDFTKQKN